MGHINHNQCHHTKDQAVIDQEDIHQDIIHAVEEVVVEVDTTIIIIAFEEDLNHHLHRIQLVTPEAINPDRICINNMVSIPEK